MNTIEQFNSHVMGTYGRFDAVMESGKEVDISAIL